MTFLQLQQTEEYILKIVDNQTVLVTIDKNTKTFLKISSFMLLRRK